jgi:FkbM family methyltransferase
MELRGFYWRLPFNKSRVFTMKIFPGYTIKYCRSGDIGELLYKHEFLVGRKKSFEYPSMELFSSMIKRGDIILDVGANTGLYSVFYSKLAGETGKVFAFEPDAETYKILLKNLKLNNCTNVVPFNYALSDKECIIEMVSELANDAHLKTGDAFKYMKESNNISPVSPGKNSMKAICLDSLEEIKNLEKINFIKIDVEGAELLVLRGAKQTLQKHKPKIVFELSGQLTRRFDYKPFQVLLLLHELNYSMDEYDPQQWLAVSAM